MTHLVELSLGSREERLDQGAALKLKRLLRNSTNGGPAGVLLRGLAVKAGGPTPTDYAAGYHPHSSDEVVLQAAHGLGMLVGYRGERAGAPIQDVVPVARDADSAVNSGSRVLFDFHTENAHHGMPPDVLGLLCLRSAVDDDCSTYLADCRLVESRVSAAARVQLAKREFRTRPGISFSRGDVSDSGLIHAILPTRAVAEGYRFNSHNTIGLTEPANSALSEFVEACRSVSISISLQVGDLLIINNRVAAHSRGSFTPRFNGADRWLRRFYVSFDRRGEENPWLASASIV